MGKIVLIMGATSGIGEATAIAFAAQKHDVIITGRRGERLRDLKEMLETNYGINVCIASFDIRDRAMCEAAIEALPKKFKDIDILVNSAGLASGLEHLDEGDPNDWNVMIDTNIKGLLYITRVVAKGMTERKSGHIINIGSTAGVQIYENGGVYCATKHAVHALSQSMRIDFLSQGIKVTEIRPGKVETEFSLVRFRGDEERAKDAYKGFKPLSGEDIANVAVWVTNQPSHVCVNEIVVTPTEQADTFYLKRT